MVDVGQYNEVYNRKAEKQGEFSLKSKKPLQNRSGFPMKHYEKN